MVGRLLDIVEIEELTHVAGGAGGGGRGPCPQVMEAGRWRSGLKHRRGKGQRSELPRDNGTK